MRKPTYVGALLTCISGTVLAAPGILTVERPQPMIVQLADSPTEQPDLGDNRIANRAGFGNLRPAAMGHIQRLEAGYRFRAKHGFSHAIRGFSADLTSAQVAQLRQDPGVVRIEPDVRGFAMAQEVPYGISNTGAGKSAAIKAGDGLNNGFPLSAVKVYVLDSGVAPHPDLNLDPQIDYVGDGQLGDCNGHGTHVAGIIGAKDDSFGVVGMAPGVAMVPLRVLDCSAQGYASNMIKAVDYTASQAVLSPNMKAVLNASIGFAPGTVVSALDLALQNAVNAGLVVVTAAGNYGTQACGTSFLNLSSATKATGLLAVAAVDAGNVPASYSNYGPCVGGWAPGTNVLSTSNTGSTQYRSGTSMAAPHVAGAAAVVRAIHPTWTPAQVDAELKSSSQRQAAVAQDGGAVSTLDMSGATSPALSIAEVTPSTLDFGVNRASKTLSVVRTLSVVNRGTTAMAIQGIKRLPTGVSQTANNCAAVAPGQGCVLTFKFTASKRTTIAAKTETVGASVNATVAIAAQAN